MKPVVSFNETDGFKLRTSHETTSFVDDATIETFGFNRRKLSEEASSVLILPHSTDFISVFREKALPLRRH